MATKNQLQQNQYAQSPNILGRVARITFVGGLLLTAVLAPSGRHAGESGKQGPTRGGGGVELTTSGYYGYLEHSPRDANHQLFVDPSDGQVYFTSDNGQTWRTVVAPPITQLGDNSRVVNAGFMPDKGAGARPANDEFQVTRASADGQTASVELDVVASDGEAYRNDASVGHINLAAAHGEWSQEGDVHSYELVASKGGGDQVPALTASDMTKGSA